MELLYKATDGTIFKTEEECKLYDERIQLVTLFLIKSTPFKDKDGKINSQFKVLGVRGPVFLGDEHRYMLADLYCTKYIGPKFQIDTDRYPKSMWELSWLTEDDVELYKNVNVTNFDPYYDTQPINGNWTEKFYVFDGKSMASYTKLHEVPEYKNVGQQCLVSVHNEIIDWPKKKVVVKDENVNVSAVLKKAPKKNGK